MAPVPVNRELKTGNRESVLSQVVPEGVDVFVSSSGQAEDDEARGLGIGRDGVQGGDGVGRLEGGDDPLGTRQVDEGVHDLMVVGDFVLRTAALFEEGVFGTDRR